MRPVALGRGTSETDRCRGKGESKKQGPSWVAGRGEGGSLCFLLSQKGATSDKEATAGSLPPVFGSNSLGRGQGYSEEPCAPPRGHKGNSPRPWQSSRAYHQQSKPGSGGNPPPFPPKNLSEKVFKH